MITQNMNNVKQLNPTLKYCCKQLDPTLKLHRDWIYFEAKSKYKQIICNLEHLQ